MNNIRSRDTVTPVIPQNRIKSPAEHIPDIDQVRMLWDSKVSVAQRVWNRLTKTELLEAKGQKWLLVEMILKRHSITRDEANKQVNGFFETHMS